MSYIEVKLESMENYGSEFVTPCYFSFSNVEFACSFVKKAVTCGNVIVSMRKVEDED